MRSLPLAFLALACGSVLCAQQVPDSAFRLHNRQPAFPPEAGPVVCVDSAHHNFHTLENRYYAFGRLLRGDGFRTMSLSKRLEPPALASCTVLVIANALAVPVGQSGVDFNASAFRPEEITQLIAWVIGGGRLLLITDHAPYPAAAANLAMPLGAVAINGSVRYRMFGELPDTAIRALTEQYGITADSVQRVLGPLGTLGDHAILRGRPGVDVPVRTLLTFGGSAFFPAEEVRPLLQVPVRAKGTVRRTGLSGEHSPHYTLEGWLVGGARELGAGRVVILGEAAMCSAQLAGPERNPMGMNDPLAVDNARFCLNVIRWLTGVI